MKLRTLNLLCIAVALSSPGCKKLAKKVSQEVAAEVQKGAAGPSDAERATMGQYAEGFNVMIGDPQKCLKEYFDDVPEAGPAPDEKYRFFPAHTRGAMELKKAKASFDAAGKAAPESLQSIAPLAAAAVADLEKACSAFEQAHKYYGAEDYEDDEGKKGKELHEQMLQAAKASHASLEKLEGALSEVEERQNKEELEQFAADKGYGYWFRLFNFEANKLLKAGQPEKFTGAFKGVDKAYTDLRKFSDGKAGGLNDTFKAYVGQVDRFHSTAKKLGRVMAEAEPKEAEIQSLRSQLVSAYNGLVGTSNGLRQLEASDLLK